MTKTGNTANTNMKPIMEYLKEIEELNAKLKYEIENPFMVRKYPSDFISEQEAETSESLSSKIGQ